MNSFEEVQFATGFKIITFPAACYLLLIATGPYLAKGIAAAIAAELTASHLNHGAQDFIALRVFGEILEDV
jgi:hypothetical protein